MTTSRVSMEYKHRMASNFRSIINDLKRRPQDAARDLGITEEEVTEILSGETEISQQVVDKALEVWPVSPRDFFLLRDDCPNGVRVMRADSTLESARVMSRAGSDYYEYRDTAMSSVSAFRPEWIQELCIVEDNSAENPLVQWNNGHFLHQFTYFIGPVNFYYRDHDGRKQVATMQTGDSMYIAPFIPHSFTTRKNDKGELGLILALTYSNKLGGEAQQELSLLGREQAGKLLLDFGSGAKASGSLAKFHREALSMPKEALANHLGVSSDALESFEGGGSEVDFDFLENVAEQLKVSVRELLPSGIPDARVHILTREERREWVVKNASGETAYEIAELCSAESLPFSKALEITVTESSVDSHTWLDTGTHQYVFNLGPSPVRLHWSFGETQFEEEIEAGASFYMKPGTRHAFTGAKAQLLVLRIGGRVGGDVLQELAHIRPDDLERVLGESMQWFDPRGRKNV